MKIKLVDFKCIDMDGAAEIDHGLSIGEVYDVVDIDIESGSFSVINSFGMPVKFFYDEKEAKS